MNFNIIGAGLAGSFIANELKKNKISFQIFDNNELFASSKISENLFSETWLKELPYVKDSMNYLFNNYEVEKKRFNTNSKIQEVWHIPINKILISDYINKKVTSINEEGLFCGNEFYKGINIVCAGFFTKKLIRIDNLNSLTGHGLLFDNSESNSKIKETMRHFRPFLHEKVMKWHDGRIWYGDSTTIVHDNYIKKQNKYIQETLERSSKIGLSGNYKIYFGARPFINSKEKRFGLYRKLSNNNYCFTGGWKDGMVIYPYMINKLKKDIGI
jgi:hypothetical protein